MASTPKDPQKAKFDLAIDKDTYDTFIRKCSQMGYAAKTILEKLVKNFNDTGRF
jgi:hypothetical protein